MPLETSSDSYFPDATPDSSPDPYATSTSTSFSSTNLTSIPAHIDIDSLPHGLPILGPLSGYSSTNLRRILHARFSTLSHTLSRPLTSDEQTALAYHTAKGHAIASYGPTVGLSFGAYRTWATWSKFRWPLYGSLLSEEPGKGFWNGKDLRLGGKEVLKKLSPESKANLLHGLRGSAYASLGMLIVPMFVSAYAATVSAVGEIRDRRLQDVTTELRRLASVNVQGRRQGAVDRSTGQGGKSAAEVWKERRERIGGEGVDDASPTAGNGEGMYEESGRLNGMGDIGRVMDDGQMETEERRAQPVETRDSPQNRASTSQIEKAEGQPRNFADDYDDASPTGGIGAAADDAGGSSVWEQIRNQSSKGRHPVPSISRERRRDIRQEQRERRIGIRQEQQDGSTNGDSFAFSSSEEERSYAKDEAQREFDEKVEKERRGGDFNSDSGKRW